MVLRKLDVHDDAASGNVQCSPDGIVSGVQQWLDIVGVWSPPYMHS